MLDESTNRATSASCWLLKFGFGTLLLFGLLSESLASTLGDLRWVFAGYFLRPIVVKSVDSP